MPFSSTQMKALCLQAQHWTLRITSKAFCGWMGCVQCCGCGLYNLAALGNYKDKWREAQCITHPVSERGLRLGNFVFSKAAHTPLWLPCFSLLLVCIHILLYFPSYICFSVYSILLLLSISLSLSCLLLIGRYGSVHFHFLCSTNCFSTSCNYKCYCQHISNEIKE